MADMTDKLFLYAVARIRTKELALLSKSDIDQLISCKSEKECLRMLADKGWGTGNDTDSDKLLANERIKTWELMRELVKDMSVINTFLYGNDFHNLKAAIKKVYTNSDLEGIFMPNGTVETELLLKAVREHDFTQIPEYMRECAEEAYQVLFHTGDSQLCEVIIDKAALQTIYKQGMQSGNELLAEYAELKTAFADINIIVRCIRTGKDESFMKRALAECESLDIDRLANAAVNEGFEGVLAYLERTPYADAVTPLRTSMSAFECWCDNRIIELIKPQKYNPFTISPLAAYILARDNEIKTVRILLSGKRNDIPDSAIRERLRDMYV